MERNWRVFWELGVDEPRVDAGKGMYGEVVREWALSRCGEDRAGHQREEGRYRKFHVGQLVSVENSCEKIKVLSDICCVGTAIHLRSLAGHFSSNRRGTCAVYLINLQRDFRPCFLEIVAVYSLVSLLLTRYCSPDGGD